MISFRRDQPPSSSVGNHASSLHEEVPPDSRQSTLTNDIRDNDGEETYFRVTAVPVTFLPPRFFFFFFFEISLYPGIYYIFVR